MQKNKKRMLSVQNRQEESRKSVKRTISLRKNIFKMLFKGMEFLWLLIQISEYIRQIFK